LCLFGIIGVLPIQAQALWLNEGEVMLKRERLDRRGLKLQAATSGSIGLGEHECDVMTPLKESFEGLLSKGGRSSKSDPHARSEKLRVEL
jgi:hypothetical protein